MSQAAAAANPLAEAMEDQGVAFNPTIPQDDFLFTAKRFPAFVGGYGSGKTEALICRAILGKIRNPEVDRGFYEPTYDLVRMIAWPRFEEILTNLGVPYRLIKHPKNELQIAGHGSIFFRSMENPEKIIGYQHGDAEVDEIDTLKPDKALQVWRKIMARNRQRKHGTEVVDLGGGITQIRPRRSTIATATTPEGYGFVYRTWKKKRPSDEYELIRAPSHSNPHLDEDYIPTLREIYPENLVDAYIEGLFVNMATGTVYTSFNREQHNTSIVQEPGEPLFVGMDFNIGKMAAVLHVKRDGAPIAIGEILGAYDTPHMITLILEQYPGHPIFVYPDASGKNRDTRGGERASETDITLLKAAKFKVRAKSKNPPIRDRVLAMNTAFEHRGYRVNVDRCPGYTGTLEEQAYNVNGQPDKGDDADHPNDAAGYFIHFDYPVERPVLSTSIGMIS